MTFHNDWFTVFQFLLLTASVLLVFLVIKYYYDKRKLFRLGAKIPGPKPWPLVGNILDFLDSDPVPDVLAKFIKYKENHKLCAVWFGHHLLVQIYTPDLMQTFCQSPKLLDRTKRTKYGEPLAQNGLILANGAQWKKAKKLMELALPYSSLKTFIPAFQKEGEILIQCLQLEVGKPCFSLSSYVKKCTFDMISEVTVEFKEKAQSLETSLVKDIDMFLHLSTKRIFQIWQHSDFLFKLSSEGKEFFRIVDFVVKKANDEINKRKEEYEEEKKKLHVADEEFEITKRKVFWQVLFDDESLTLDDIRDHIFTILVAGYETTSNAVCFAVVMLALHQDVQERAYQEVVSVVDGDFDEEKLRKLEYLEMIIKETLRLYPPVAMNVRKATEDVQMGEYLIPGGAEVAMNIYELHRDPEQYENPHIFNPDHFLPENIAKRHPYSFLPFSGGLRKCIGNKFAMYVMKVLVSLLLQHYKFECDYKSLEDVKVRSVITLTMPDGFQVRILKR